MITCPNCGYRNREGSNFCINCGNKLENIVQSMKFCQNCGYQNEASSKFCLKCGHQLETQELSPNDSNDSQGSFDGAKNSFRYLDYLIHCGVKKIVLDSDITLNDDEEHYYKEGIKLDVDGIVIDGKDHIIDARGKTRIFNCTGKNITIKKVTLKKGFGGKYGGAILNEGELEVVDSTLVMNRAKWGGAINNMAELTLTNSTLEKNIADTGGAIHSTEGTLKIFGSDLNDNVAEDSSGGAIFSYTKLTVIDSTLKNNTAPGNGGAIKCDGESTIDDCVLGMNRAEWGGAIYNQGNLIITDSLLTHNSVNPGHGAVFNSCVTLKVTEIVSQLELETTSVEKYEIRKK